MCRFPRGVGLFHLVNRFSNAQNCRNRALRYSRGRGLGTGSRSREGTECVAGAGGRGAAQGFPLLVWKVLGKPALTFGHDPSWFWEALAGCRLLLLLTYGPPQPEGLVLMACLGSSSPPPRPGGSPSNPAGTPQISP